MSTLNAGIALRILRENLGMTMRDVEIASEKIARSRSSEEFFIPISRISDVETKGVTPSIYRMYSLGVIYKINVEQIFAIYGIEFELGQPRREISNAQSPTERESVIDDRSGAIAKKDIATPIAGRFMLDLLLPRKHRESLVGDIEQDYRTNILPRYGRKAASFWFWKQVLTEIVPGLYLRIIASVAKHFFWKAN
jgi:transcriptional regulator with XRE-family HTH domain